MPLASARRIAGRPLWRRLVAAAAFALTLALPVPATSAGAAVRADYGDAPDSRPTGYGGARGGGVGRFPSLSRSRGPRHTEPGLLRLGSAFEQESDSRQVDRDVGDDGFFARLRPCRASRLTFVVDASRLPASLRSAGHTAYLNAWLDWNRDGRWRDASRCSGRRIAEWRVRNRPLDMASFAGDPVQVIVVDVVAGPHVAELWARASLTLDQRHAGPAGQGRFAHGETEDHFERGAGPTPKRRPAKRRRAGSYTPACAADWMDHGDSLTVLVVFFASRASAPQLDTPNGVTATIVNGTGGLPALPGDVAVAPSLLGTGFVVTSLAVDERANILEPVKVWLRLRSADLDDKDKLIDCDVLIVHAHRHPEPGRPGGAGTGTAGSGSPGPTDGGGPGTDPSGRPPVAAFSVSPNAPPSAPKTGQTVTFDGSASSDPDGRVVAWSWNFGNGATGSGTNPGTQYLAPGRYVVTLTVTDDRGITGTTSRDVYVSGSGAKDATLDDVPCDAAGGAVSINIPSYAQNPVATLKTALAGCPGRSITNLHATLVQGPAPGTAQADADDEWGRPKNHLVITFDLSGSPTSGTGSATFSASWT